MRAQRAAQRVSGQYGFDARIVLQATATASTFILGQIAVQPLTECQTDVLHCSSSSHSSFRFSTIIYHRHNSTLFVILDVGAHFE